MRYPNNLTSQVTKYSEKIRVESSDFERAMREYDKESVLKRSVLYEIFSCNYLKYFRKPNFFQPNAIGYHKNVSLNLKFPCPLFQKPY